MLLQSVLEGGEFVTLSNKLCDIRDGARAHILAAERPEAEVRHSNPTRAIIQPPVLVQHSWSDYAPLTSANRQHFGPDESSLQGTPWLPLLYSLDLSFP